ncbi:hemerythrin HHE cation binding domain-containing protein [Trichoderma breve]|uniref:Hemerythrin HHE cation binding domain-containing protein n=1 Tax=Trichoderma breve TaxID=2034170 RepID=A0A9W9B3J1_9HYPO|nr:hemerythrin HHE cation binding domain-containing protein [Trichoderma breve]KAJ4855327.1 hemerythrin HHE cation binding domain-containing protein [Trichoderma breve]
MAEACDKNDASAAKEELPPLTDHEFKNYNRLAERMELFHNNFRRSWNILWQACTTGRRPQGMSIKQLLNIGTEFAEHLTIHHSIEETYFFPRLAQKMPEFNPKNGDLVKQHAQIHEGLEGFEKYLNEVKSGERDFELSVLKEKMESWGGVLWTHLDDEVRSLGAENMRKFWTLQEIRRFQM